MRRMVKSLLHEPTVRARKLAQEGRAEDYLAGLEALFGIEVPEPEAKHASDACEPTSADPAAHERGTEHVRGHRDTTTNSEPRLRSVPRAAG